MKMLHTTKQKWKGFFFITPWFLGFIFFFLRPFISSFIYSFNVMKVTDTIELKFVGFQNYIDAFGSDPYFFQYLLQALSKMVYQVPLILFFSLFIAIILNQKFWSRGFYRGVFFLPTIISCGVVMGIIRGDAVFNAMQYGEKTTYMFQAVSLQEILLSINLNANVVSYISTIINSLFELLWFSGMQIIIFLAGLQNISISIKEAALIDGANGWDYFWLITFPMVSPLILTNTIYTIISTFTDYTNPVINYINQFAAKLENSTAATMSIIYFFISFIIIIIVYLIINRSVFYRNA